MKKKYIEIKKEYLDKILDGSKVVEIRQWYQNLNNKYIALKEVESKTVKAVIKISEVIDLNELNDDQKEHIIFEFGKVTELMYNSYPCNYAYVIEEVHLIN